MGILYIYTYMKKRFLWTLLITLISLIVLIPFFNYLYTAPKNISEAANRNFVQSFANFALLIFIASFLVVNVFFIVHPDHTSMVQRHKEEHDLPEKYYQDPHKNTTDIDKDPEYDTSKNNNKKDSEQ